MSSQKLQEDDLYKIRHSLAHIMAQAVMELRPGTKLGFGPPVEDGFYYDFILSTPVTETDFPSIEHKMRQIIQQNHSFHREELPQQEALTRLETMGEPYKKEYAQELFKKKQLKHLTFYQSGPFLDMCDGPHVQNTRDLPLAGFKLRNLAGAYWRGDAQKQKMTRIYAWAFSSEHALKNRLREFEEAQKRDHKKLGKELGIFCIDEQIGKGLPLWLPHGTIIRDELEKFMKELEFQDDYQRVCTPHLAKSELYEQTGHLPYYASSMYPGMQLQEETGLPAEKYYLRPMNCPHHHRIFAAQPRSYRDLPLRLAEYGQVYRFENSGALSGLLRVRGMCQNDAHIYCTKDQIKDEFLKVLKLYQKAYKVLKIEIHQMRLSTWDPEDLKRKEKFMDEPEEWEWTQNLLRDILMAAEIDFEEGLGEAAFYGPKLDIQLRSVTGREETASTIQLDFGVARRIKLKYTSSDDQQYSPYIIHRAPLGTHERLVAFLIEKYGGAFPTWLAPIQVRILPVSQRHEDYAEKILALLKKNWVRAELDDSSETINKKIRIASHLKIPNLLILGDREQSNITVTWRIFGQKEQETLSLDDFTKLLLEKIMTRS